MAERGVEHALLLTLGETETIEVEAGTVRVLPTWRWVLEPPAAPFA